RQQGEVFRLVTQNESRESGSDGRAGTGPRRDSALRASPAERGGTRFAQDPSAGIGKILRPAVGLRSKNPNPAKAAWSMWLEPWLEPCGTQLGWPCSLPPCREGKDVRGTGGGDIKPS